MQERRVLVGEHNTALREAVRRVLACSPELRVVVEASTGTDAIRDAIDHRPDIAILDVHLPGRNGIELAGELRRKLPQTRVVLLLGDDGEVYRLAAARQGAACAVKDRLVEDLPLAITSRGAERGRGPITEMRGELPMRTNVKDGALRMIVTESSGARVNKVLVSHALRAALVVFLVGALFLGFAGWLSNGYQQAAIERSVFAASDGTSIVVDNQGFLGRAGAIVRLNPTDRDSYIQQATAAREKELTLCIGIGFLALAVCSLLLGWHEARDAALT